jgi:DNA-binding NarL/FixJ family response regulator
MALTGRLMECAAFVSCGLSNKDIAKRLKLSEGTIKSYISECFGRLRIRGRLALALWYRNNFGLVDGSDALVGVYE